MDTHSRWLSEYHQKGRTGIRICWVMAEKGLDGQWIGREEQ
jgi:hypothetical protein